MKNRFETPMLNIIRFDTENIITTSGTFDNVKQMEESMKGYTVTKQKIINFEF